MSTIITPISDSGTITSDANVAAAAVPITTRPIPIPSSSQAACSHGKYTIRGIREWGGFRSLASERGWIVTKGATAAEKAKMTHLLLDGGMLAVPPSDFDLFYREYYHYARFECESLFINELKTSPLFNMLAEFDLYVTDLLTKEQLDCLIEVVQVGMSNFVGEDVNTHVLVAMPTLPTAIDLQKNPKDPARTCYKYGIHFVWPTLPVDQRTAKLLRWGLIRALEESAKMDMYSSRLLQPITPWEEVLDIAVFLKNGLRLLWSPKSKPCPDCHGKVLMGIKGRSASKGKESEKKKTLAKEEKEEEEEQLPDEKLCPTCQGLGKVNAGRPYDFYGAFDSEGHLDEDLTAELKQDELRLLQQISIRLKEQPKTGRIHLQEEEELIPYINAFEAEKNNSRALSVVHHPAIPPPLPTAQIIPTADAQEKSADQSRTSSFASNSDEKKQGTPRKTATATSSGSIETYVAANGYKYKRFAFVDLDGMDPKWRVISNFIAQQEGSPVVKHVRSNHPSATLIYTASTTCKFCPNKQSEHNSSTNYFIIHVFGAQRRCFSTKPVLYPANDGKKFATTCKDWRGPLIELPDEVRHALFSDAEIQKFGAKQKQDELKRQVRRQKIRDSKNPISADLASLSISPSIFGLSDECSLSFSSAVAAAPSTVFFLPSSLDASTATSSSTSPTPLLMKSDESDSPIRGLYPSSSPSPYPRGKTMGLLSSPSSSSSPSTMGSVSPIGINRSTSAMVLCSPFDLPASVVAQRYQRNAVLAAAAAQSEGLGNPAGKKRRKS